MKCGKCGAEWTTSVQNKNNVCPFCGETLNESVPYQQAVDVFRIIVDRFGPAIYLEKSRLYGLVNDLLPNTAKEKNILKTVISLDVPRIVAAIMTDAAARTEKLKAGYDALEKGGLSDVWCSIALYILSYPLGVDSTDLFPLKEEQNRQGLILTTASSVYDARTDEVYSSKPYDELVNLSSAGDAIAKTELGVRHLSGNGAERDINKSIRYLLEASAAEYPVADFILGSLYDEGKELPRDYTAAYRYYERAAKHGYPHAQKTLGRLYFTGEECTKNDAEALYWMKKAADAMEDADTYLGLAMIYMSSEDVSVRSEIEAFRYAKMAAELEDVNAYNLLGTYYEKGLGTEKNYDLALHYYRLAAENGVEMGYFNLGSMYHSGYAVQQDDKKAVEYFQYGADVGNMLCIHALAMCYWYGYGVIQDYKKAFDLFLESAYAGNAASEQNIGVAYDGGFGVEPDKMEANKWFLLAAEHGNSQAMVSLGTYEQEGTLSGEPNPSNAFHWYLKAAEIGDNALAAMAAASCYDKGYGTEIDRCLAFTWYLSAAELGMADAQHIVAMEYLEGEIVEPNTPLAIEWYEKSISQDNAAALDDYGTILLYGRGLPRNINRGLSMIKKAAELGDSDAQGTLGICYFEGWGTPRNLDEALKWLVLGYNAGNEETLEYLQKGFKEKNGVWSKRGIFGRIPQPEELPPVDFQRECKGGCDTTCRYYDVEKTREISETNEYSYCKRRSYNMNAGDFSEVGKVFTKKKCPFFRCM